jgi:hypothetical protein
MLGWRIVAQQRSGGKILLRAVSTRIGESRALLQIVAHRSHKSLSIYARPRAARAGRCATGAFPAARRHLSQDKRSARTRETRLSAHPRACSHSFRAATLFAHRACLRRCFFIPYAPISESEWSGGSAGCPRRKSETRPKIAGTHTVWGIPPWSWPLGGIVCNKPDTSDYGASRSDPEHVTTKARRRHT